MANGQERRTLSLQDLQQEAEQVTERGRSLSLQDLQSEQDQSERVFSLDDLRQDVTVQKSAEQIQAIEREQAIQQAFAKRTDSDVGRGRSAFGSFIEGLSEWLVTGPIKTKALFEAKMDEWVFGADYDPRFTPDYLSGVAIGQSLAEIFPTNTEYRDEFWAGTMAQGAGQLTGQVITTIASGGLGTAGVLTANTLAGVGMSAQYYEEAKANGADDDTAFQATLLNITGNAGLNAIPMALMVRRVDKVTGGGVKNLLKNGFKGSLEEGLTEAVQQMFSNTVASKLYDTTRDLMDGVAEGAAAGFLLGGTANIGFTALFNEGMNTTDPERKAAIKESIAYLDEQTPEQLGDVPRNDVNQFLDSLKIEDKKTGETKPKTPAKEEATVTGTGIADPKRVTDPDSRSAWRRFFDKWLADSPLGEKMITHIRERNQAWARTEQKRAELFIHRLNSAILDYVGSKEKTITKAREKGEIDGKLFEILNEALQNPELMNAVPEQLRAPLQDMRRHIDRLSREIIKRGFAQGKLATEIENNLGTYIHRTYKIHDQKQAWGKEYVSEQDWNRAVVTVKNALRAKAREEGRDIGTEESLTRQAEQELRDMLYTVQEGTIGNLFKTKPDALDGNEASVFMQRDDIHPNIRKVMGENTEASYNYITTIQRMSETISTRQTFDSLIRNYRGTLFKTREDLSRMPDDRKWRYKFKKDEVAGSEISDYYMHKDLYEALTWQKRPENQSPWLTYLFRFNAASKYAKTILSHITVIRNVFGGAMFMAHNGLFFNMQAGTPAFESARQAFLSLKQLDKKGLAEKNLEYELLNLIGKSVRAGELTDVGLDAKLLQEDFHKANMDFLEKLSTLGKGSVVKKAGTLLNIASDFYKAGDDFIRIWFYELEKARLQKADPSITNEQVAQIVNDTYQNYDRVNRFAQSFRRIPFIAPFISFPSEVIRTVGNSAKRAYQEINSDNAELNKIGYQRIAGMISTTIGVGAMGLASQHMLGVTDEEDQAYREFMPPWDENSIIVYTQAGDGTVKYINTSYINPYAYLLDPMVAIFTGADDETVMDIALNGMSQLMEPILSQEIFAGTLLELNANQKAIGGEIWNPQDTIGDKLQKMSLHMWNAFEPGSISSVRRAIDKAYGSDSKGKAEEELMGLFGMRMINVDVEESFGFSIREQRQAIRDSRRVYNSVKFREGASEAEIEDAYQRSNAQYEAIFNRMRVITEAAQTTGVWWEDLEQIMKDSGLSQRDIQALQTGVFRPFER